MSQSQPFCPMYGSGTTTAVVAVSTPVTLAKGLKTLRIANVGANGGWFRVGVGAGTTATAADVFMPAGAVETFRKDETHDTIALLSVAGGTSFHVIQGEGW